MTEITASNVESEVAEEEKKLFLNPKEIVEKPEQVSMLKPPPDGGYGWVILAASFSISFILDGIMYSFGILLDAIKDYYEISIQKANLLTSLYTGFFLLCGPLVSGIVNQYGCRVAIISGAVVTSLMYFVSIFSPNIYFMYASIGVIGGCSTGIFYISSLIIIAEYFDKKKGIATGITMAGSGIGFFIGPPILDKSIQLFGWKITTVACAGALLINAFIGILSKPLNPPKSQISFGKKKKTIVQEVNVEIMSGSIVSLKKENSAKKETMFVSIFKEMVNFKLLKENWRFLFMTLSNLFVFTGYFLPFLIVKKVAELNGIANPSFIISIIGIVNIPGRILFGTLADIRIVTPVTLNTLTVLLGALPLLTYDNYLQHHFWTQAVFAGLYALSTSGLVCLTTPYLIDLVGSDKFANATGIVSLFRGIGCFAGPYIGGIIADSFSRSKAFYFCGICYIFGFIFSCIVSFSPQPKKTEDEKANEAHGS